MLHVVHTVLFGRGDDTVGNLIELKFLNSSFEIILLLNSDKQFPVEQFEATVSQSTVPSPPLNYSYEEFTRLAETRLAQNSLNYLNIC